MGSETSRSSELIKGITSPLGFYVLALLIVESFMAIVGPKSGDPMMGMWVGVGLFVYITAIVTLLACFNPEALTFDKEAHLKVRHPSSAYANPASTSNALREFWKPDGKKVDADNKETLRTWMARRRPATPR